MKQYLRADFFAGVLTCMVVATLTLYLMTGIEDFSLHRILLTGALFIGFIGLWIYCVRDETENLSFSLQLSLLLVLFFITIAIYFLTPFQFSAILMGVLCSMLPFYFPNRLGVILVVIASSPLYLVYAFYWQHNGAFITAILFLTFNFFAFAMMRIVRNEKLAREEAESANLRLVSTQSMLEQAVKQAERVRIARNIHDLLGHHLTALSINLQVASRQSNGEVKDSIDKCHHLAKLLLSDVREAVSDIRNKGAIDLRDAIEKMQAKVLGLDIKIDIAPSLLIDEIETADTLVKCIQESITNTLKHAHGKTIHIRVLEGEENIRLTIENDGLMPKAVNLGNGLKGMQERVSDLKGLISFHVKNARFVTDITLPRMQYD